MRMTRFMRRTYGVERPETSAALPIPSHPFGGSVLGEAGECDLQPGQAIVSRPLKTARGGVNFEDGLRRVFDQGTLHVRAQPLAGIPLPGSVHASTGI